MNELELFASAQNDNASAREAAALSSCGFCKKTAEILDAAINITISGQPVEEKGENHD